jgi:methionyl-tRNA formyltransferase
VKLGYFADGPWAHRALDAILSDGHFEVGFLVLRYQNPDAALQAAARRLHCPCYIVANVNDARFVSTVVAAAADLLVSMSFDQIFRDAIRGAAPLGCINCHAGALPFYRGRNVLNWALINGEPRIGVTVHHVDDGIDTGDIIVQDFCDLSVDDDYAQALEKAYAQCPITLMKALRALRTGTASRTPQSAMHAVGSYFPRRVAGDEWIDWSWPSQRIHNFVRGIAPPGPGARAVLRGASIAVLKTHLVANAPSYIAAPGAIIGRGPDAIWVKSGDSFLAVDRLARVAGDCRLEPDMPLPPIGARFSKGG